MKVIIDIITVYKPESWLEGIIIIEYENNKIHLNINRTKKLEFYDDLRYLKLANNCYLEFVDSYSIIIDRHRFILPSIYNNKIKKVIIDILALLTF
jgi:hypothetical protein